MKDQERLTDIVNKAAKGGWSVASFWLGFMEERRYDLKPYEVRGIFTQKDFAIGFWGNGMMCLGCGLRNLGQNHNCISTIFQKEYAYQLQQMVVENDFVDYLEKFL